MQQVKIQDCERLYKDLNDFVHESIIEIHRADMSINDYVLLMPDIIKKFIIMGADAVYMNNSHRGISTIMGIDIRPGYEMKFVLYHPDYCLWKQPEMFFSKEVNIEL